MSLSKAEKLEMIKLMEEKERRANGRKLYTYYPDTGPLRRELYPKHMQFFAAGKTHRERGFMGANRIGKTEGTGGYETALHATGDYPKWWPGRVFNRPISAWAAGNTGKTTRDIIQKKLLGPITDIGTGLIPREFIVDTSSKQGVSDAIETIFVKHKKGGVSEISLKSYDQGRTAFEGTEQDLIWLDEEPDMSIYTECLLRTMTNNGLIMLTFTPLEGMSEVVLSYIPGGQING
jgi:phage terminase large subunit-like protein